MFKLSRLLCHGIFLVQANSAIIFAVVTDTITSCCPYRQYGSQFSLSFLYLYGHTTQGGLPIFLVLTTLSNFA
jgi:hypothetical protein